MGLRHELPQTFPHWSCSDKGKYKALERTKGHDVIGGIRRNFEEYKKETNQPDLILYRRFKKEWWQIWNWYYFLAAPCWDFPYSESDEDT